MCRLAAYLGADLLLHRLLDEAPHSLIKQSWASEQLQGTRLNADGFGFGWYRQDGPAAVYTSTLPIWSDSNLAGLGHSLNSRLWLAYVRSATPGQAVNQANTQPFTDGKHLFLHNGRIDDFNQGPRRALHEHLSAAMASRIEGNSDSEYLFALVKQHLSAGLSPPDALQRTSQDIGSLPGKAAALLNMIMADGESLYASRHAVNGAQCPSLYYSNTHPHYPDAVVIASEAFSLPEHWHEVKPHSLLIVNRRGEIDTLSI